MTILPTTRSALLRLATNASVFTALLLISCKGFAWLKTGSISVLASLVDSLMDGAASIINLLAVRYSLKSPDADHQFGHGKAESLAGLGQACFIAGSALFLIFHAAERFFGILEAPRHISTGIAVMIFSMTATLCLLAIQSYVIRHTESTAIKADSLHYRADLLTNGATILALFLVTAGWNWLDPVIAVLIAIYIFHSAWNIGTESVKILMDHELPDHTRQAIIDIVDNNPAVHGFHDLRTRQSGSAIIVQIHLALDRKLSLGQAHDIAKNVERDILSLYPQTDVIIHQDPVS